MRRLLLELSVATMAGGGFYYWTHRHEPVPVPVIQGAMPDLAMPAPSGRPVPSRAGDSMLVTKGALDEEPPGLNGRPRKPRALGEHPVLFAHPSPPSEEEGARVVLDQDRPGWQEALRRPGPLAAAFAVFVLFFVFLARAIWRGRSGGFTHD
ncbi:MAG: hypothetical protein KGJ84_15195 [Elusimicrobia bacterium]|nr:hypothetical protein [Elusimicrobiota bacterium]